MVFVIVPLTTLAGIVPLAPSTSSVESSANTLPFISRGADIAVSTSAFV